MCMEHMLLFCCAKDASWVTCKTAVSQPFCRMHDALHCSNMCHAAYLATQRHVDCVHPSGKLANFVLHVLFVATMYAVSLILYQYVRLQVLSRQQFAGRCTSCAKWPCSQVSPCWSSQQADNPALCYYAVNYYFKTAASNCQKKTPTKNPSSSVSMQPQKFRKSITAPILNGIK